MPTNESPKVSALDVIRRAGAHGATVGEIRAAGADPAELMDLEVSSQITTRCYAGRVVRREDQYVWVAVEHSLERAA